MTVYTIKECAAALKVHVDTVERMIAKGRLPVAKIGIREGRKGRTCIRIRETDINKLFEAS